MSGYLDAQKNPTHVISLSTPQTISTVLNAGGIIGYNVIYRTSHANPIWDITGLTTLSFKIKVGNDFQPLPSAQQIMINCKISRVIF
jgi:hypothetical protein